MNNPVQCSNLNSTFLLAMGIVTDQYLQLINLVTKDQIINKKSST
jgi:hypothetical protein